MTLDDLGSLGEFVGAVAVVISLVYLALQVRQNTRAVRSSVHQAMLDCVFRVSESVSDNPDLARIAHKADRDYDSLTPEELARFEAYADRTFGGWENVFYNAHHGMVGSDIWKSWQRALEVDLLEPGLRRFWRKRRDQYLPDLAAFVDEFIRTHPLDADSPGDADRE